METQRVFTRPEAASAISAIDQHVASIKGMTLQLAKAVHAPVPTREEFVTAKENYTRQKHTYLGQQSRSEFHKTLAGPRPFAPLSDNTRQAADRSIAATKAAIKQHKETCAELRTEIEQAAHEYAQEFFGVRVAKDELMECRAALEGASAALAADSAPMSVDLGDRTTTVSTAEEVEALEAQLRAQLEAAEEEAEEAEKELQSSERICDAVAATEGELQERIQALDAAKKERDEEEASGAQQLANMNFWYTQMLKASAALTHMEVTACTRRRLEVRYDGFGPTSVRLAVCLAPMSRAEEAEARAIADSASASAAAGQGETAAMFLPLGFPVSAQLQPAVFSVDDLVDAVGPLANMSGAGSAPPAAFFEQGRTPAEKALSFIVRHVHARLAARSA